MGWGRFLLDVELGRQMGLDAQRHSLEELRSAFLSQYHRDGLQEQHLWQLWVENLELKVTLNRLTGLLVRRGVLTPDDVLSLAREMEQIGCGGTPTPAIPAGPAPADGRAEDAG